MWLIVGLGNPGKRYEDSRHNIGFMVVDYLARVYRIHLKKGLNALRGKGVVQGEDLILAKPQTFMNMSGVAVNALVGYLKIPIENLLVIYDDIDLPYGRLRIRKRGGAGGHRGMESIISQLGTKDFPRVRLGIGRPKGKGQGSGTRQEDIVEYVLDRFNSEEEDELNEILSKAKEAVDTIIRDGIEKAMDRFNKSR